MDDIVVLRNGISLLGMQNALPYDIVQHAKYKIPNPSLSPSPRLRLRSESCANSKKCQVVEFLSRLPTEFKEKSRSRVYYFERERENNGNDDLGQGGYEEKEVVGRAGGKMKSLLEKENVLREREDIKSPYLAELRNDIGNRGEEDTGRGMQRLEGWVWETVKTIVQYDMKVFPSNPPNEENASPNPTSNTISTSITPLHSI
eukprot:1357792-Amorphochlora_amoeboformis.AAC.1